MSISRIHDTERAAGQLGGRCETSVVGCLVENAVTHSLPSPPSRPNPSGHWFLPILPTKKTRLNNSVKADAEGRGPAWKANRGDVRVAPETVLLVLVCSYWKGLLLVGSIPFFKCF